MPISAVDIKCSDTSKAKRVIFKESGRSEKYLAGGDQISEYWAGCLKVSNGAEKISGTGLSGVNVLFEQANTPEELSELANKFISVTSPGAAQDALMKLSEKTDWTLEDASVHNIAYLTLAGVTRLRELGDNQLAEDWLEVWQGRMKIQMLAEQDKNSLRMGTAQVTRHSDITTAVADYLIRFSETSALPAAVLGSFPFAENPSNDLLKGITTLLDIHSPLSRLDQDIEIDGKEIINTLIYTLSSITRTSLKQLTDWFIDNPGVIVAANKLMEEIWRDYFGTAEIKGKQSLESYKLGQEYDRLLNLHNTLLGLADRTVQWKKEII